MFAYTTWLTGVVNRITRRVPVVEQELLSLPEHLRSPTDFIGVRAARSLVFCVVFCRLLFVLLSLFFWPLFCLSFCDIRILITHVANTFSVLCCIISFSRSLSCTQCCLCLWIVQSCFHISVCLRRMYILLEAIYIINKINLSSKEEWFANCLV